MIYAELDYEEHYSEIHTALVELIQREFDDTQSGLQGDSWIWIFAGDEKVEVDTFTSMKHQIKSSQTNSALAEKVIRYLTQHYKVLVFAEPVPEAHE